MEKIKVFISYSHANIDLFRVFKKHFETQAKLFTNYEVEVWDDEKIPLGSNWHIEIQKALQSSHIAILLISNTYFTSPYIKKDELAKFIENYNNRQVLICPVAYSFTDYNNWGALQAIQFFKPRGADYGRADKVNNFCFADLVSFGMVNGVKLPNEMSEIEQYMTDFKNSIDSQKEVIDEIIEVKKNSVTPNPKNIEIEITEPKNNKEMTYIELIKMSLSAIPYIAPYVQKWTEKMTEGLAEDMYQYGKTLFAKDPKKLQLLEEAKKKQLTKEETTEFQEIAVEIAETQKTKAILQKYIPEDMSYDDFKKLIEEETDMSVAFDALDIFYPKMKDKVAYNELKNDFIDDKMRLNTRSIRQRLKVLAKKFLA